MTLITIKCNKKQGFNIIKRKKDSKKGVNKHDQNKKEKKENRE